MMAERPAQLLWLAAGFGLWSSALVAIYTLHALGCAYGWSGASLRIGIALVLLAHVAILLTLVRWQPRSTPPGSACSSTSCGCPPAR